MLSDPGAALAGVSGNWGTLVEHDGDSVPGDELRGVRLEVIIAEPQKAGTHRVVLAWNEAARRTLDEQAAINLPDQLIGPMFEISDSAFASILSANRHCNASRAFHVAARLLALESSSGSAQNRSTPKIFSVARCHEDSAEL